MLFGVIHGKHIGRAEVKTHLLEDRTTKHFTYSVWLEGGITEMLVTVSQSEGNLNKELALSASLKGGG